VCLVFLCLVPLGVAACDGGGGGGNGGGGAAGGSSTGGGGGSGGGGALEPGQCRTDADCAGNGEYCAVEGPEYCGGAGCLLEPCSADADCQAMGLSVCEEVACCGGTHCIPGCDADNPCPVGQTCTADNHCVAQPCAEEACPANFDCGSGADPSCARRACGSDTDCDGYCVLGGCYPEPGFCDLPKP